MALYRKPKGLKYVDMCIWIDENAYRQDLTEEENNRLFEYLYHIAKMLAYKGNYFLRQEYYDDFAIFFATNVYFRYKNPKQFEINEETGEPKLTKLKSCLNYMKNVGSLRKIEFEQNTFSSVFSTDTLDEDYVSYDLNYSFADQLSHSTDLLDRADFDLCLGSVCQTTETFLKQIPYPYKSLTWYNIYLSCVLTLLSCFTLTNRTLKSISKLKSDVTDKINTFEKLYKGKPKEYVILYHLDRSMHDYIWILVQQIKKLIAKDLSIKSNTRIQSNNLNALALADINLEEYQWGE